MKKGMKKILALGLNAVMITSSLPTDVLAEVPGEGKMGQEVQVQTQDQLTQLAQTAQMVKEPTEEYAQGQVLVIFKEQIKDGGESEVQIESAAGVVARENDMTLENVWNFKNSEEGEGRTGDAENAAVTEEDLVIGLMKSDTLTTEQMIERLKKDDSVELAEPDYHCYAAGITEDSYSDYQWGVSNEGQNGGTDGLDGNPDYVWNGAEGVVDATSATDKVIAIIDTGVDYTHPELCDNMWENPFQGVLEGEHGYDYVNLDPDPMDDHGHGTHCSGIMAATADNQSGISGVNKSAKIMALKFLDAGGEGDISDAISAYDYIYQAMHLGVDVAAVNNSWGGGGYSQILLRIINKVGAMGAVSVFAAGNEATDNDVITEDDYIEEGNTKAVESPYVINVAASNEKDELTQFSNFGKRTVTLAAPGADILSTVSYPCFNPGIYTIEQREALCGNFEDYETDSIPTYSQNEKGTYVAAQRMQGMPYRVEVRKTAQENRSEAVVSTELSDETYFGTKGGKAMNVSVMGAKAGDNIYVTIPYDATANAAISESISAMLQATEKVNGTILGTSMVAFYAAQADQTEGLIAQEMAGASMIAAYGLQQEGPGTYWDHVSAMLPLYQGDTSKSMDLVIQIACLNNGDYTLCLDDFGVSKGIDANESASFGKYDYYNGTSMAAPCVTGATALLATAYPNINAKELVNVLSGCVRRNAELESLTSAGGVLDLSMLQTPSPLLSEAVFSTDGTLKITGYGFVTDKTTVTIAGNTVKATVVSEKELRVDAEAYKNRQAEIVVTTPYGTVSKNYYLVKGKTAYQTKTESMDLIYWPKENQSDLQMKSHGVTDGENLYLYDAKMEMMLTLDRNGEVVTVTYLTPTDLGERGETEGAVVTLESNLVYLNGKIYALKATKAYGSSYKSITLMAYDPVNLIEENLGELPSEYCNQTGMSLGAYNGRLYLIGGYDYSTKSLSTKVMAASKLGQADMSWKKASSLPEGRAFGECIQSGDKLYYALGAAKQNAEGKSDCPKLLSFDGKKWSLEGSTIAPLGKNTRTYNQANYDIYSGNLGLYKNGLLFSGMPCDGLGDTFYYNTSSKTYKATNRNYIETLGQDYFVGNVVDDTLIGEAGRDGIVSYVSTTVKSGMLTVNSVSRTHGTVSMNKVRFLPGEKITVKAVPNKGYYVKSFTVDGKKVSGVKKTLYATSNVSVNASYSAYVTKLTMNKKKANLKVGKTLKLAVTVAPKSAGNKNVTWKSSNTKYATVSSSGKVTAKKAGAGKTVTISATAKDGSKVKATCKITIKKS